MLRTKGHLVGLGVLLVVLTTGCQLVNQPAIPIPELFEDSVITGTIVRQGAEVIRQRFVKINLDLLGEISGKPASQAIVLNLFKDTVFTARLDRVEQTRSGHAWIGHIENVKLSDVVFVVVDQIVAGSITMPGASYSIEYAGNGMHAIYEINQADFPPD